MAGSIRIYSEESLSIENVLQDLILVSFRIGSMFRMENYSYRDKELDYIEVFFQKNYQEPEDQFIDFSVFSVPEPFMEGGWNVIAQSSHLDGKIAIDFGYEYLKLKQNHKLAFNTEQLFSYNDMKRIHSESYREDWMDQKE